jgi:hypothetical protein
MVFLMHRPLRETMRGMKLHGSTELANQEYVSK